MLRVDKSTQQCLSCPKASHSGTLRACSKAAKIENVQTISTLFHLALILSELITSRVEGISVTAIQIELMLATDPMYSES